MGDARTYYTPICFSLHTVAHHCTVCSTVVSHHSKPFQDVLNMKTLIMMLIMILVGRSRLVNSLLFEPLHLPPGKRDLISIVRDLFSLKALWTDGAIIHAISSLPPSDFVAPVPVPWSDSVARNLIPVEAYSEYSESERRFIQLATVRDWTQSETHDVLKVLKDVLFLLEDICTYFVRRVIFVITHYYTLLHIVFNDCQLICLVQHGRSPW